MINDNLITFCKDHNLNIHLITKFYDINNLNEKKLKEIEVNKSRFISQNIEYAKEVLDSSDVLKESTKQSLINTLKSSNFSVVYEPSKIETLDSILDYIANNQQQLIDYFDIENNNITPLKILNREVSNIANDLIKTIETSKDKPLLKSIDIVETKLNMISKATIDIKRKFTLTKEDSILLDDIFSDIKNSIETLSSQLINKELETSLMNDEITALSESVIEPINNQISIKELNELKQDIQELKDLQLSNCIALDDIDYLLKSSKLITSLKNKGVVKKEIISINSNYKLIKVE